MSLRFASACLCFVVACSSDGPADSPPTAPAENDAAYSIGRIGGWYLIGNELTPGQDELEIEVAAPGGTGEVDMWLNGASGLRLSKVGQNTFGARLDISDLDAGEHELILAVPGESEAFARVTFNRTHPLYVVVSTDWDDPDNSELSLDLQEQLHERHPELKLTHFVGPYTFTEPEMTPQRMGELVDWAVNMRDTYGDEIGLHIHPYCSFVESAGVTCRTQPSFVYDTGDETGYTVQCAAYTEDEFTTLLEHADELFEANGLGKPTTFRAGGWSANLTVLNALGRAGYVADTSANNWARMEEWKEVQNGELFRWNEENWATIGDTSQPYYPSSDDILRTGGTMIPVLEVPDNGILVDYVTADEMIEIFGANWNGEALLEPANYSIGWHPSNFNQSYQQRMDQTMDHLDQFLASSHNGPVVYEILKNMPTVWPIPQ